MAKGDALKETFDLKEMAKHGVRDELIDRLKKSFDWRLHPVMEKWEDETIITFYRTKFRQKFPDGHLRLLDEVLDDLEGPDQTCFNLVAREHALLAAGKRNQKEEAKLSDVDLFDAFCEQLKEMVDFARSGNPEDPVTDETTIDVEKARDWLDTRDWIGQPFLASRAYRLLRNIGSLSEAAAKFVNWATTAGQKLLAAAEEPSEKILTSVTNLRKQTTALHRSVWN